jgi:FAD/FMN-containing dehydrogenase
MDSPGQSWGRYPRVEQKIVRVSDRTRDLDISNTGSSVLPHGNGRSYGDSCLNGGGTLIHTRGLDRFISFDPATGRLECEAGVLLADILDLVVPQGWFLPVTPGTKFVTIGGAIANDVHGKNHHRTGTFGRHVTSFVLLRSDGERMTCSANENPTLYAASIGGLGLTGLIVTAQIQLRRIAGPWLSTETHRFRNLGSFFELSQASDRSYEYTVAWIDCAARGDALGRGLFTRANHAPANPESKPAAPSGHLSVPVTPPISLVNRLSLRSFNALYYRKQRRDVIHSTSHYEPQFYPLDGIGRWNRLYGPRGLLQYQCVIPPASAREGITELVTAIAASGSGSFLAVLKEFGDMPSPGMLSFPRPGTTLALDFPNDGMTTFALLDRLDDIVAAAGGAVYPAKDARMSGRHFRQYFPQWESFAPHIDPRFSSSFWRRVME